MGLLTELSLVLYPVNTWRAGFVGKNMSSLSLPLPDVMTIASCWTSNRFLDQALYALERSNWRIAQVRSLSTFFQLLA